MRHFLHPLLLMTDANGTAFHPGHHPDSGTIAAFVDRVLTVPERDALLAHFASCTDCRRAMTDVHAAVLAIGRTTSPAHRRSWRWILPLAAAAVLILAVRPPRPSPVPAGDTASRVRGADAGVDAAAERGHVAVVEPADGDTLGGERRLAWRPGGADATYQVTVQDSAGASVWSAPRSDTTAAIPASTSLRSGARYYWSVDVRRADGSTGRSVVHRFIAP